MSRELTEALHAYDLAAPETEARRQSLGLIIEAARKVSAGYERYMLWLAQVQGIVGGAVDPDGYSHTLYHDGASPAEAAQELE